MNPKLRYAAGTWIRVQMRRLARQFFKKTADPRAAQHGLLRELLALNADSEFGRRHGLEQIHSPADFRSRLPISDYAYFQPYIERMKRGETSALLGSGNRLLMFALTSGTTTGSKFLPITERFFRDYRRGWQIWSIRAFDDHPSLYFHEIAQLTSDHEQFLTSAGHACGNISGLVTAMQQPLVRTMYAVPGAVSKIKSPDAKYYTAMRLSLANRIVGLITTANPSTLIQLAKIGDGYRDEIIRDIADGTLSRRFDVPEHVRQALAGRVRRKRRRRARELEQIIARTGRLYPKGCWTGMSLLAVWIGGSAGAYIGGLRTR
ncbi:MAG TPA: GH3 auxin-responsive promoter family protein, partial [Planctomycetaceae bacterium]|nr:GH3 auxin-responsive promoter family protein [Planctomycetaceae bacterium]